MFKKKRDYGYYSSYGTSSRSRLKVGRVALVGAVGVVLVIGIVVVLNLTRIKLLIKGYSFSQASEILSLTKEQENEILSHDKLDHCWCKSIHSPRRCRSSTPKYFTRFTWRWSHIKNYLIL